MYSGIRTVCIQDSSDGVNGQFMRVRVVIGVSKPLNWAQVIPLEDGVKDWVTFRLERLPNISYWCSCLTYADKDCDLWLDSEGTLIYRVPKIWSIASGSSIYCIKKKKN